LDGTARVWRSTGGKGLVVLKDDTGRAYSASFSPDGTRVVTASGFIARVCGSTSGREMAVLAAHTDPVRSASFSPDGRKVVTASYDRTARVWDSGDGTELVVLRGHTDWVTSALFSPDGQKVVTASRDDTARVWDSSTGKVIAVLKGHTSHLQQASFSSDGTRIVTPSGDPIRLWDPSAKDLAVRVWDSSSGKELAVLRGHTDRAWQASFSPDGKRIVTASEDGTARIWRRYRPEWWWGVFCMLEFWFSAGFAAALVWSLFADGRAFARMDAEAAREKENRSRPGLK
jgi:WD40 repeat protein